MERYLASGAIKGIGQALASKIVKIFGADTFRVIEEEPELLTKVKGISAKKAMDISMQMHEKIDLRDALVFLQKYGVSGSMAVRIFHRYGTNIYSILRENPYRMATEVAGIRFKTADPNFVSKAVCSTCCCRRRQEGIAIFLWDFFYGKQRGCWGFWRKEKILKRLRKSS